MAGLEAPDHLNAEQKAIWEAVTSEMGDELAQTDAVTIEAFVCLWARAREAGRERDICKANEEFGKMARWEAIERQAWTALRPFIAELAASPMAKAKLDKLATKKSAADSLGPNPMTKGSTE